MPTGLLVFDLDGTLVDSSRDLASALNATLERMAPGTPPISVEAVVSYVGDGARVLVERSLRHTGLSLPLDEVLSVYLECYRDRLLDETYLYPGVAEALGELAGETLAVLTNKPGGMSRAILKGLGVGSRFARIWGPEDVPARKPSPSGLLRLLAELGADAGSAWMVGDSGTDVETARKAGVKAAGVTWGFHPDSLRAAAPDLLIDRPGDLVRLMAA
jgi:phosphoglycolate phosphatase